MSADYWLEVDTGGPELSETFNVTYNLGPMLRAAGLPAWGDLLGKPAAEVAVVLGQVDARLHFDRVALVKEHTPSNGWGDWDDAVRFVREFLTACRYHPKAVVGGWL